MRLVACIAFFAGLLWNTPVFAASPPFSGVLGADAHVKAEVEIPGGSGTIAVLYQSPEWKLGVVKSTGERYELLWNRNLSGIPSELSAPGPAGVFRALDRVPDSRRETLYAYEVVDTRVRSVVHGAPVGSISGADGIIQHPDGFSVRKPDEQHTGAVPYRFVTRYAWNGRLYGPEATVREPDYAKSEYPVPSGWTTTAHGDTILIKLQVADTEALREQGLMGQSSLDPDSGMLFAWGAETHDSFWMEDTPIPLSIAFLGRDGKVQEIQDMQAETTNLHTPAQPYWYAIEANLGYFAANGITVGDTLHLLPAAALGH